MANAERDKPGARYGSRPQNGCMIPLDSVGTQYGYELDLYLNQLLDEAVDEPRPGGDTLSRLEIDKK